MQRGKIFTAVAWGLGGLFLCAAAAVGFATQGFGLAELPDPQPEDWAQAYTTTWDTEEDPVRGLDISWFHGPVELRVGEGQYVTVTEEAQQELPEEDRLELTSSGGVLRIKWNSQLLALDLLEHNSKALVVEVPRETAEDLEELRCQAVSGLVTVSGFAAGEMELSSDSGGLALSDLRAGELTGGGQRGEAHRRVRGDGLPGPGGRAVGRFHLRGGGHRPGPVPPGRQAPVRVGRAYPGPAGERRL